MDQYVPSEQRMDEVTMEDVLEGMILAGQVNPCWPREPYMRQRLRTNVVNLSP